jgi:hypothetical protein
MGAKRNSRKSHGPANPGGEVHVDSEAVQASPPLPAKLHAPVPSGEPEGEGGPDGGRPSVGKAPQRRGGDRFTAAGRGRGAPQARRYAFRRS